MKGFFPSGRRSCEQWPAALWTLSDHKQAEKGDFVIGRTGRARQREGGGHGDNVGEKKSWSVKGREGRGHWQVGG